MSKNNNNIEDIWKDLKSWQNEINTKDEALNRRKLVHDQVLPPVQSSTEIILDSLKPEGLQTLSTKKQISKPTATNLKTRAEKAEAEKGKGNEYFGKKDYKNAILHYTKAIELDPTISVYFVNRAMAHLKLNNFLEAEKDCTRGIQLQPKNVKALWRRGIALRELGRIEEARRDFEAGLTIEPNNKSILDELKKLPLSSSLPKKTTEKKSEPAEQTRKLNINVIDEAYPKSTNIKQINSKESTKKVKIQEPFNKQPAMAQEHKPVKIQPARTEKHELKAENKNTAQIPTFSKKPLKINVPHSNYEFERDWKTFKGRGDEELYKYFQTIPPNSYASIFKSSLESDQFEKMIDILGTKYMKEKTPKDIFHVLEGLSYVKRIDMLVMFLSKKEQQVLQDLFNLLKNSGDDVPIETVTKLSKIYGIRI